MTFIKTMQTPAIAENKKWLWILVRFFKKYWLQSEPNEESCQGRFRHSTTVATSATLCTIWRCWRHFKADRRFLLPWKRNLKVDYGLICVLLCMYWASNMYDFLQQAQPSHWLLSSACQPGVSYTPGCTRIF